MTRNTTRRRMLATASGTVMGSLVGCLGVTANDDSTETTPEDPPANAGELGTPAELITVTVSSQPRPEFIPQIIHVEVGATVEWLVETGRHDVTAYHENNHPPHRTPDGVDAWASERLPGPGSVYERTFDVEGVYDYVDRQTVCISHEIAGNIGRIVVGWPNPADEPAMEPLSVGEGSELPTRVENTFEMFDEETRPVLEAGSEGTERWPAEPTTPTKSEADREPQRERKAMITTEENDDENPTHVR